MEHITHCPICGSGQIQNAFRVEDHSVSKEEFVLSDCKDCGFRFTSERPPLDRLASYYISDDYISHSNRKASLQDNLYQLARRWSLRNKTEIIRGYQPHGRVLDIGCGTGEFLAHLRSQGFLVQGVEPSAIARGQAISNHGLNVVPGLDQVASQENFSVVSMWHVLEHVPDIRQTFKKIFALLAEGGLLVIAVPDRESWDAQHYGSDWAAWDVPRHLSHFRRQDIETLLREHGFELLKIKRMPLDALYISMLSERYSGLSGSIALIKGTLFGLWSNVVSLFNQRPTSSSLYLARKAEL